MTLDESLVDLLSEEARKALEQFYSEKEQLTSQFETLRQSSEKEFQRINMDIFREDWQLSQFWYTEETANKLAGFLASGRKSICISAPTAFVAFKNTYCDNGSQCKLLEFDSRFDVFDEFIKYDYKNPLSLRGLERNCADVILADPPFLSEECLVKTCMTVRYLASNNSTKILFCTGAVMGETLKRLIPGMRECTFKPEHRSGLSNEFRCFSNFENETFKWI